MCVVAIALNVDPRRPVLLIGNRDEFHARPSAAIARWGKAGEADHHVIGGRDLESGGSWLGVSERGRLAVVTNIRSSSPPDPGKASRGALVADFLRGSGEFSRLEMQRLDAFNPFHLLTLEHRGRAVHFTNSPDHSAHDIGDGILALSNGGRQARWPRKDRLAAELQAWTRQNSDDLRDLLSILRSEEGGDEGSLPNFLSGQAYGTRCSTIIAIDAGGAGQIIERRFGAGGIEAGTSSIDFRWPVDA